MASSSDAATFYIFHRDKSGKPDHLYDIGEVEFTLALISINVARQLLQHERYQRALAEIADLMRPKMPDAWWKDIASNEVARMFTDKILKVFVMMYIDDGLTDPNITGCHFRREPKNEFDPHDQAIVLNGARFRDMCEAAKKAEESNDPNSKESKRYRTFVFLYALTIMHELAHVFVTYLSRGGTDTPPEVNAGDTTNTKEAEGESGAYLEQTVLGGIVMHARDPNDDAGQAGIPHLKTKTNLGQISQKTVDETIRCEFKFPLTINGPPISEPLKPLRSESQSDDISDPLDWPETKDMMAKHTSNPFKFSETSSLMAANPNIKRVRVGLKSALVEIAFKPGIRVKAE